MRIQRRIVGIIAFTYVGWLVVGSCSYSMILAVVVAAAALAYKYIVVMDLCRAHTVGGSALLLLLLQHVLQSVF